MRVQCATPLSGAVLVAGLYFFSWCAAPLLQAYFFADDFYLLAVARWIGNPLAAFGDHFAEGELYRPLGLLSWSAAFAMFGSNAGGHYELNLMLHGFNGILVFVILNSLFRSRILNAVLSLLFLLHPATVSTTGWLAARFDLLATAFIIAALYSARRYLLVGEVGWLLAATLSAIFSILSKETGYIILPVTFLALLGWGRLPRYRLICLILAQMLVSGALLAFRFSILTLAPNGFLEHMFVGFSSWLGVLISNLTYYDLLWQQRTQILIPLAVIGIALIVAVIQFREGGVPLKYKDSPTGNDTPLPVAESFLVGFGIIFFTGIIQARNVNLLPAPNSTDLLVSFLSSRFFYLPLFGLVLAIGGLMHTLIEANWRVLRFLGVVFAGVLLLVSGEYGVMGRNIVEKWCDGTNVHRVLIEDAVHTAINHFAKNPGRPLILENTSSYSWYFPEYVSYIMFALLPAGDVAKSALVMTEKLPANIPFTGARGAEGVAKKGWRSPKILGNISIYYPGDGWIELNQAIRMIYRIDGLGHGFY